MKLWNSIAGTRAHIKNRIHFNQHWLILFDQKQAAQYVMRFEFEFFDIDKTGLEMIAIPLNIDRVGTYTLSMVLAEKQKVNAAQMAAFMTKICGYTVTVADIEQTNLLAWSDKAAGKMMFQLFDIFMGEDFEKVH